MKLDVEISKKLIQSIHGLVWKGFKKGTPYRDGQNVIRDGATGNIVYMPPEAKDVSILMNNLIDWTQKMMLENEIPTPIVAALFHYQFATIHPFYDGNGRTARLLTTFILRKMGYGMKGMYSLEEYYAKNLQGYYKALTIGASHNYYGGRAEADVTPFLDYFLEGMAISFRSVRQKTQLLKALNQDRTIHFQKKKLRELRPHQKQTLSLFIKNKEVSIQEIAAHLGLKSRSTYTLVKKWIDDGFIQIENKSRKSRTYVLTKQWELLIAQELER